MLAEEVKTAPGRTSSVDDDQTGSTLELQSNIHKKDKISATNPVGRKQWQEFGWLVLYMLPATIIFVLFFYLPFFRAIWLSLHITNTIGEPVRFVGLRYYSEILQLTPDRPEDYLSNLLISFQFVLLVVPAGIGVGVLLAVLAAIKLRGIGLFRTIFTSSVTISLASAGVVWALIYNPSAGMTRWLVELLRLPAPGLLANAATALTAVAVMTVWASLGFNFLISLAGIQAIPSELYECARLDGAGGVRLFRHITLPLLTPTLLFLLIVNTIQSFQAFTQFNILMNGIGPEGSTNVFIYTAFRTFWLDNRYGLASAMSIVLFGVLFILAFVQFRLLDQRVNYLQA